MARIKSLFFVISILIFMLTFPAYSETLNSSTYIIESATESGGGASVGSSNYNNIVSSGGIAETSTSSNYIIQSGFVQNLLQADGQPCSSDSQCEGGFCCSNVCQSTVCPTTTTTAPTSEPSAGASGGGGGGGGGGGAAPSVIIEEAKFTVSPNNLRYSLGLGDEEKQLITITNTGELELSLDTSISDGIKDFVWLSDNYVELEPTQQKTISVNAIGKKLGSYFGEATFTDGVTTKPVTVIVDVESKIVLFDVKLDILSKFKKVNQGDNLRMQITLLNMGAPKLVDVIVTYLIKDKFGNVIHEESETFAVDKQRSYEKSIKIPENLAFEDYLAVIEVRYADSFAVSSDIFSVVKEPILEYPLEILSNARYRIISMLIGAIIILSLIFIIIMRYTKSKNEV